MAKDKEFPDESQDFYAGIKEKDSLKNEDLKYDPENPYVGVEKSDEDSNN